MSNKKLSIFHQKTRQFQSDLIIEYLTRNKFNYSKVARLLGLSRFTVARIMQEFNIDEEVLP